MNVRRLPGAAAVISVVVGVIVLTGWAADVGTLKRITPGLPSMKANTAIGFILAGAALWLIRDDPSTRVRCRAARALGTVLFVLAVVTLAEYVFHVDLRIDGLFHDSEAHGYPGRPSPHSALAAPRSACGSPRSRRPARATCR